MKGFVNNQAKYLIFLAVTGFVVWTNHGVNGACLIQEKKIWAYTNPSTEHFTDSLKILSSDKGEHCRWVIRSSEDDSYVKLKFSNFQLQNSTNSGIGDRLEIYDGNSKNKMDELFNKLPRESYSSTSREILVVYSRGSVGGVRKFSMTYTAHTTLSKEKIIQIAGIIGAILAALGIGYVILKVTKCCKCLRAKDNTDNNQTTRENDRLVLNVHQGSDTPGNTANRSISQNNSQPVASSSNSPPLAIQEGDSGNEAAHDSDIDSLQDMNEVPPSYESLYLNELGESVTPPKYSPPRHRSGHPPRRVNTFN